MKSIPTKDIKIISFDVFDTCIARLYARPTDLFIAVAEKSCPDNIPKSKKEEFVKFFLHERITAENTCNRMHGKKRSCHFDEIYNIITIPPQYPINKEKIAQLELKLEKESTYAITKTLNLIENYRSKNNKIIFISDMYLDKGFIKDLLIHHGFFKESDELYVSSENTLTKKSGLLFKHVLSSEKILPYELWHHGDDLTADIKIPSRLGIKTSHISNTHCWPSETLSPKNIINSGASQIAGLSKFLRQTEFSQYTKSQLEIINLVTLLITAFTLWLFNRASEKGINTLYFLAKDNDITYKIASELNRLYPTITVKYLYGSRRAWLTPSIELGDDTWKRLAIPDGYSSSINDALQRLNFSSDEIGEISKNTNLTGFDFDNKNHPEECTVLLTKLFEIPTNKEILISHIKKSREICVQYLRQEGLFDRKTWAIVDTGWQLNCQSALKRIINSVDSERKIVGFYLGLSESHLPSTVAGDAYSFTEPGSLFAKRPIAVEHIYFPSTHSSTINYFREGELIKPNFMPVDKNIADNEYTKLLHEYAIFFNKSLLRIGISHHLINNTESIISMASNFLSNPSKDLLPELHNIFASEDSLHSKDTIKPIFEPITFNEIYRKLYLSLKNRNTNIRYTWIEASATEANIIIRLIFKLFVLMKGKSNFDPNVEYRNRDN